MHHYPLNPQVDQHVFGSEKISCKVTRVVIGHEKLMGGVSSSISLYSISNMFTYGFGSTYGVLSSIICFFGGGEVIDACALTIELISSKCFLILAELINASRVDEVSGRRGCSIIAFP